MNPEANISSPLLDRILDETFKVLELRQEFDDENIRKLRQLAKLKGLGSPEKVADILIPKAEKNR